MPVQQIQWRRDTTANWASANPVLLAGEVGYESDTSRFKVGNGSSSWSALTYFSSDAGAANGLPAGGATGQVLGKTGSADYAVGWVADQVGAGGGIDAEAAVDAVATAMTTGTRTGITITYNDAPGTFDFVVTGGGGGGLTNGDKGDIVVGSLGESLTFDPTVVTSAAKTVLDDASVAAMRTTLGVTAMGTATTLASVNSAITDADVPAALNGLTGVWIGTQAQYDAIGTKVSTVLYAIT